MELSEFLGNVPKDRFRQTANKLLNECFLLKNCADTKNSYYFVMRNKDIFTAYFELLGYELNITEEFGIISLYNPFGTGRIRLSKIESIILLLLRLIYIEQRRKILDTDDVIITSDDIYEKYKTLKLKKPLGKTQMRSCLAKLKKYHIIQNLDTDMGSAETRIQIYHSVALAISAVSLEELYKSSEHKLKTYTESGENDESEEYSDEENFDQT